MTALRSCEEHGRRARRIAHAAGIPVAARDPEVDAASKIADRPHPRTMPRSPATPPEPASYEQALAELERLVQAMEGGQMPLDQLLVSYQRGADLLQACRARLQAVEEQVKVLDEGLLKPWAGS